MLSAMGFDRSAAETALTVCNGNVEAAANFLLSGGTDDPSSSSPFIQHQSISDEPPSAGTMIVASSSQYSFDNGRSACTCMALQMAKTFLTQITAVGDALQVVRPEFMDQSLPQGVQVYESIAKNSSDEHLSAEQALPYFLKENDMQQEGGIVNGLLSNDTSHPLGLSQLLRQNQQQSRWCCIIITKTPETVLVCLPPRDTVATGNSHNFVLLDSHPRPHLWAQATQAYAKCHTRLEDLLHSLQAIFPVVDLGNDIPELMAAMYNSFDLYVLTRSATS